MRSQSSSTLGSINAYSKDALLAVGNKPRLSANLTSMSQDTDTHAIGSEALEGCSCLKSCLMLTWREKMLKFTLKTLRVN
jgi:hypothetical protein